MQQFFRRWVATALLCVAAATLGAAHASHFLGGSIQAERAVRVDNPTLDSVTITFNATWRAAGSPFDPFPGGTPAVGQTYTIGETIAYEFTNGVTGTLNLPLTVLAVNTRENWVVTRTVLTISGGKTLAKLNFTGCCRGSEILEGNGNAAYRLTMEVPALQNGQAWKSATATPFGVLYQLEGTANSFRIPMDRPEGLTLTAAVAPLVNSSLNVPRPVGTAACAVGGSAYPCNQCISEPLSGACADAMRVASNGVTTWTPQTAGSYAVQFDAARYDIFGTRKDSVPLDLLLRVMPPCTAGPPTCMPAPTVSVVPTYQATAGTPLSIPVTVSTSVNQATLALAYTALPSGMTIGATNGPAPQLVSTLNWTPTFANAGSHEICFAAVAESTMYSGLSMGNFGRPCLVITVPGPSVPDPPVMIAALRANVAGGGHTVNVRFEPPANNGGATITKYRVISNPPGGVDALAVPGNMTLWRDITNLFNGTSYTFTVVATNSAGDSLPSAVSDPVIPATKPLAPTILSILPGDTEVRVNVVENSGLEGNGGLPLTAISVGSPDGGNDISVGSVLSGTHVVTGLVNGQAYDFYATSFNPLGNSPPSAPIRATPGPLKPQIGMGFVDSAIVFGQGTTLNIALTNPNPVTTMGGLTYSTSLPAGVVATAGTQSVCGGTLTTTANSIAFSGGSIVASSVCTASVAVTGAQVNASPWSMSISNLSTTTATLGGTILPANATIRVDKAVTATALLSALPASLLVGQPYALSFAVSVNAPGAGTPGGTVTLSDGHSSCNATLPATTCTLIAATQGPVTVTARYNGDARFAVSTSAATQTSVVAATSTTLLSHLPAATVIGQSYQVNIGVAVTAPGSGTPGGTVTVSDGSNSCVITLPATACTLPSTTAGDATLTATYSGGGTLLGSVSAPVTHSISRALTTTALVSDKPDPSAVNLPVVVTATVAVTAPGAGAPDGSVAISDGVDGCTITLPATSCVWMPTRTGTLTLTAAYGGSARYVDSQAASASHTVVAADQQSAVTVSRAGSGSGTVSTDDSVIDCGAACAHVYAHGTSLLFTATPADGSQFTGWLGGCTGKALCALNIFEPVELLATFAPALPPLNLDIDGNAAADLLSDGLLMIRYLSALPDDALVQGAIGSGAPERVTAGQVREYLANLKPMLDIDADGIVDANTDGVLLLRYLSGLRGSALTANAIGGTARRGSPAAVEAYIASLLPPAVPSGLP